MSGVRGFLVEVVGSFLFVVILIFMFFIWKMLELFLGFNVVFVDLDLLVSWLGFMLFGVKVFNFFLLGGGLVIGFFVINFF